MPVVSAFITISATVLAARVTSLLVISCSAVVLLPEWQPPVRSPTLLWILLNSLKHRQNVASPIKRGQRDMLCTEGLC
ncbi:predicted protein [Lichtheimia corymbifera JMRC:FSU:9682]|uniref:Uncharacterized protein n=1 Tax=Lichtheimia corymbifera JMRC:FSU:9682 TaxID=1263082 RepID=A0A068S4I8_9FUNG|nr:predicted protein [Lichtheimia corymbifera JMRC:FSU:9682]